MHSARLLQNIQALFLVSMSGMWVSSRENDTHTLTGMLCQHSSITEGGNGTISLLTGKSCNSVDLTEFMWKRAERVLGACATV